MCIFSGQDGLPNHHNGGLGSSLVTTTGNEKSIGTIFPIGFMRNTLGGEGQTEPFLYAAADRTGSGGASAAYLREKVGDLFTPHPVTVAADMAVRDVISLMQRHQIGAVLLESRGRLAGIFSERDVVNRYLGLDIDPNTPVNTLVSGTDVSVQPTDDLAHAIEVMAQHKLRHLPVCNNFQQIVGILSVRNIIDCLAQHYPTEVINQPPTPRPHRSAEGE